MPGQYENNTFTSCDADAGEGPGIYPLANGSTSTFRQRYTGSYTDGAGALQYWTVGDLSTPAAPFTTPASSNCVTYSSVGSESGACNDAISPDPPRTDGINTQNLVAGTPSTTAAGSSGTAAASGSSSRSGSASSGTPTARTSASGAGAAASSSAPASGAIPSYGLGSWANALTVALSVGGMAIGAAVLVL